MNGTKIESQVANVAVWKKKNYTSRYLICIAKDKKHLQMLI
jgi:hypothetical protein